MNQLVTPKSHTEPADYRGPFDPVRAAIRTTGHSTWCHRCDESTVHARRIQEAEETCA